MINALSFQNSTVSLPCCRPATHSNPPHHQEALKEPNYHSSSQAALRTAELANETLGFLFSQMLLESQRGAEATSLLKGEVAKLKHEQGRVTMQVNDAAARSRWNGR